MNSSIPFISSRHFVRFLLAALLVLLAGELAAQNHKRLTRTAQKNYDSRQYQAAVENACQALMMEPAYDKAQQVLVMAFPAMTNELEGSIRQLKTASATFTGYRTVDQKKEIMDKYEVLMKVNQQVSSLPAMTGKKSGRKVTVEAKDYHQAYASATEEWRQSKREAAEVYYLLGLDLAAKEDVNSQKQAAKAFKDAQSFVPGYKDAATRYQQARKAGTKRIAIIPFENLSGKMHYGAIGAKITDDILSQLHNDRTSMEFTEFITRDQLEMVLQEQQLGRTGDIDESTAMQIGKIMGVHEIITGRITQIISHESPTQERTYQNTQNVVVDRVAYLNDAGKKRYKNVYGDVTAQVYEYTKPATAKIHGSYKVVDVKTARIVKTGSFTETADFTQQWAKFRGDERALSAQATNLAKTPERPSPSDEERVNQVAVKLVSTLAGEIKAHAR